MSSLLMECLKWRQLTYLYYTFSFLLGFDVQDDTPALLSMSNTTDVLNYHSLLISDTYCCIIVFIIMGYNQALVHHLISYPHNFNHVVDYRGPPWP